MAIDKSTVKIRLESETGDRVSLSDVGDVRSGLRLSCATTGKLKSLDTDGNGELSLQELVNSLDAQARQKHQLFLQRCVIAAGVLLLVCSFGLSLGSSVLSFMLMSQLEVHSGALTDREGHVLGSQPKHPTVHNVTAGEAAARRLDSGGPGDEHFKMPFETFTQAFDQYKGGSTEFVVPIDDAVFTAQVEGATPTTAHGVSESGDWWVRCDEDAGHCSVMVDQLRLRAAAFLDKDKGKGGAPERRLFWNIDWSAKQGSNGDGDVLGTDRAKNPCTQKGSYEVGACVYHDLFLDRILENRVCQTNWCYGVCCYADRDTLRADCPNCLTDGDGATKHYSSSDLGLGANNR